MVRLAANLSFLFTEHPFEARFRHAAAAGFKAVEILFPHMESLSPGRLRATLHEHNLDLVLFNAPPGDWPRQRGIGALPGEEDAFRRSIEDGLKIARSTECGLMHVLAGLTTEGAELDTFVDRLQWAAKLAEPEGVRLCIEPLNRHDMPNYAVPDVASALELIDIVDKPNVGLQLDLYHLQRTSGDLISSIRQFRTAPGRAPPFHVQLANPPGRHEPGVGEVDFPLVLAALDEIGYDGHVGCEYTPSTAPDTLASLGWAKAYGVAPPGGK